MADTTGDDGLPLPCSSSDACGVVQSASVGPAQEIHVPVETFGSGALLEADLAIAVDKTVEHLRQLVLETVVCPVTTREVRLFVGHGGTELCDNTMLIGDSTLGDDQDKPLVVFRTLCTSLLWCLRSLTIRMPAAPRIMSPTFVRSCCGRARSRRSGHVWVAA